MRTDCHWLVQPNPCDFPSLFKHFMNKLLSFPVTFRTTLVLFALFLLPLTGPVRAQSPLPEPTRQELLSGLKILFWQKSGDPNVLLKMRIQSGAAYDLAGKAGMMALLGDVLFPEAETRQYFTDELGGRLEVATDYDGLTISMSGRSSGFERMIELLRNALMSTPLSPEIVTRLREARIQMLRDTNATPSSVADRAIAARLFGEFPYGRPASGAAETVARVDRGDLMQARERFLNADNATLVIVGGLDDRRTMRTLRQLLGNWRKSDRVVPPTFRQPEPPDARTLIVHRPGIQDAEIRLATRGLARADKDYLAANVLAAVARDRWQVALADISKAPVFVRHEAHTVPGMFVLGTSVKNPNAAKALAAAQSVIRSLTATPPTATELEKARSELSSELTRQLSEPASLIELWLDAETFKLGSVNQLASGLRILTASDVQAVAGRLFKEKPVAAVILGNYDELKSGFGNLEKFEVLGDPSITPATNKAGPPPTKKP
ncbi:MAG: zinc protease [Blastocatellia bacterium]|jgi:predicted Zn-dependent peptidase|nr:zinc protease [Blastocatellia bacterium]